MIHSVDWKYTEWLGVNFINIILEPFSYGSDLRSFSRITVWLCNFFAKGFWLKRLHVDEIDYRPTYRCTDGPHFLFLTFANKTWPYFYPALHYWKVRILGWAWTSLHLYNELQILTNARGRVLSQCQPERRPENIKIWKKDQCGALKDVWGIVENVLSGHVKNSFKRLEQDKTLCGSMNLKLKTKGLKT